jgi:hypothetical protein
MALNPEVRKKIANAKTGGGGTRLKAGSYVLVVKRIICDKKFSGTMFIPEVDILGAEPTEDGVTPNKEGSDASFAWALDKGGKAGEAALGNIKQFSCALLGWDEAMDDEKLMEKLGDYVGKPGEDDAVRARGMIVLCTTRRKTIQSGPNAGKVGDFPHFSHVSAEDGNDEAAIAERKADLDKRKR